MNKKSYALYSLDASFQHGAFCVIALINAQIRSAQLELCVCSYRNRLLLRAMPETINPIANRFSRVQTRMYVHVRIDFSFTGAIYSLLQPIDRQSTKLSRYVQYI